MRIFVAVELDEPCRRALAAVQEVLKGAAGGVRWVRPEGIHLTLKFIGPLDEQDLPAAVECLEAAAAGSVPFTMEVAGLGGFPARGTPRVIHVGVREPTGTLLALQAAVEAGLAERLAIAPEGRPYVPHLTLGRVKDRRACPPMERIAQAVADQQFGSVRVDSMVLMKSDLHAGGAVYTPLHRFALGN